MSFGYIGDTSTKINQKVKNKGVLSISDAFELEKLGHLGGSQKLISKHTISSDATVQFAALQGDKYKTHLIVLDQVVGTSATAQDIRIRTSNDGTNYQTSDYEYFTSDNRISAHSIQNAGGADGIFYAPDLDNGSEDRIYGWVYMHNANDSDLYTKFTTWNTLYQSSVEGRQRVGGGQREVAETTLGVQFYTASSGGFASGTITLYGIKDE
jgi:hypothetical protein